MGDDKVHICQALSWPQFVNPSTADRRTWPTGAVPDGWDAMRRELAGVGRLKQLAIQTTSIEDGAKFQCPPSRPGPPLAVASSTRVILHW